MSSSSRFIISVSGKEYEVEVRDRIGSTLRFLVEGREYSVDIRPDQVARSSAKQPSKVAPKQRQSSSVTEVQAPIPGIVSEVKVVQGSVVSTGDVLVVVEAMKMENPIRAPRTGTIKILHVSKGQEVPVGAPLVTFE